MADLYWVYLIITNLKINMKTITIDNQTDLSLKQLRHIFFESSKLHLSDSAKHAIHNSAAYIQEKLKSHETIYGVNTGFGRLAKISISDNQLKELQKNLVLSHSVGVGASLETNNVKLILSLKINSLARGYSGIRLITVNHLIKFFNHQLFPCIPSKGSVGASGDLAPLAHMALPLIGEGEVSTESEIISGKQALMRLNLKPLQLAAKEGLALLNGTQVSTGIALANYFYIERIFNAAMVAGTLSTIAAGGSPASFHPLIHKVRNQPEQEIVAACFSKLLANSRYNIATERVQSPYCIRCQPQVMGACLQQMQHAALILQREANGVSDNPLVFVNENKILSGGNFHAEPIAFVSDNLALVIAEIANISERRVAMLIDADISGLPPFLVREPGINSGFMLPQVTAAALVNENKTLAHPASIDSIPTCANQEDHVSMATFAARRLREMIENSATVIAIELLTACQGLDLTKPYLANTLQPVYELVREHAPFYDTDRSLAKEITKIKALVLDGTFSVFDTMF